MNKNTTDITLSAYFNDIIIGYYEDEDLVKRFGEGFGFDVDKDTFMAVSLLYSSDADVTKEDREKLIPAATSMIAYSPINSRIEGNQVITADYGVCLMLIAGSKEEMRGQLEDIEREVLTQVGKIRSDIKIRVGIGTMESGIKGIKESYYNSQDAIKAGEIFKKNRVLLEYVGMEIYSAINQMVVSYGDRLTRTVLKELSDRDKDVLSRYYKCKEDKALTAAKLGLSVEDVESSLNQVKINTGLDVNDIEDNFKLHFITIARKVLENDERLKRLR